MQFYDARNPEWRDNMKLKEDIIERFEKGATVWEIARLYNTSVGAVLDLLGTERSLLAEDALQWWIEQEDTINEL
jgi:hypothetical protein